MAEEYTPRYELDRASEVDRQVRDLAARAVALGMREQFFAALKTVIRRLEQDPADWGDPERLTRRPGGMVYHANSPPLLVRYIVYQPERVVCLLSVRAMPGSWLE